MEFEEHEVTSDGNFDEADMGEPELEKPKKVKVDSDNQQPTYKKLQIKDKAAINAAEGKSAGDMRPGAVDGVVQFSG